MPNLQKIPQNKIVKKSKYRFYDVGYYGSICSPASQIMLIYDKDNNSYFLYKNNRLVKHVPKDEFEKYSLVDSYGLHYKVYGQKRHKPLIMENNKFIYAKKN